MASIETCRRNETSSSVNNRARIDCVAIQKWQLAIIVNVLIVQYVCARGYMCKIWVIFGIAAQFARRSNNNSIGFYLLHIYTHSLYVEDGLTIEMVRDSFRDRAHSCLK